MDIVIGQSMVTIKKKARAQTPVEGTRTRCLDLT